MTNQATHGRSAQPKFNLGQVVATPAAIHALRQSEEMPSKFMNLHVHGNWGDISEGDRELNEETLKDGSRIMSVYSTSKSKKSGSSQTQRMRTVAVK